MDNFSMLREGDPIPKALSASRLNRLIETARETDGLYRGLGDAASKAARAHPHSTVWVVSHAALSVGSVIALGSAVMVDPTDQLIESATQPVFNSAAPSATSAVCVVIEPASTSGEMVRAVVSGAALVQITGTGSWAYPISSDITKLQAGDDGPMRILWQESGTGTRWAVVRLGGDQRGLITLREADGSPLQTGISTITFDQSDGFQLGTAASGSTTINLVAASSVRRDPFVDQNGVIVGTGLQHLPGSYGAASFVLRCPATHSQPNDNVILQTPSTWSADGTSSNGIELQVVQGNGGTLTDGGKYGHVRAQSFVSEWEDLADEYNPAWFRAEDRGWKVEAGAGVYVSTYTAASSYELVDPPEFPEITTSGANVVLANGWIGGRGFYICTAGNYQYGRGGTYGGLNFTNGILTGGSFTGLTSSSDIDGGTW